MISKKTPFAPVKRMSKKPIIWMAVAAACVIVVIIVIIVRLNEPRPTVVGPEAIDAKRAGTIRDKAIAQIDTGDTEGANRTYEAAIEAEKNVIKKTSLMIDQSEVLFNAGKQKEAIAVAKKAETLGDDKYLGADWLARVYEQQGNAQESARYYRLAGQWASSKTNVSGFDAAYYEAEAKRVEGVR